MSVSELSRGRPAAEPSQKSGGMGRVFTKVRSSLGRVASFVFVRSLVIFAVGFAAGMAWQTYGNGIRKDIAGWSSHLAWVAPPAPAGNSRERIKATTVALAAVRQSVDKLATEVDKLQDQAAEQRSGSGARRASKSR